MILCYENILVVLIYYKYIPMCLLWLRCGRDIIIIHYHPTWYAHNLNNISVSYLHVPYRNPDRSLSKSWSYEKKYDEHVGLEKKEQQIVGSINKYDEYLGLWQNVGCRKKYNKYLKVEQKVGQKLQHSVKTYITLWSHITNHTSQMNTQVKLHFIEPSGPIILWEIMRLSSMGAVIFKGTGSKVIKKNKN